MRVYIAADSHLQEEVKLLRSDLTALGIEVTARWIDVKLEAFNPVTEDELSKAALGNFLDIDRALYLIAYNPVRRQKSGTGGRHVELGYALAKCKPVLYVGEILENVFHRHPYVKWASSGRDEIREIARDLYVQIFNLYRSTATRQSER